MVEMEKEYLISLNNLMIFCIIIIIGCTSKEHSGEIYTKDKSHLIVDISAKLSKNPRNSDFLYPDSTINSRLKLLNARSFRNFCINYKKSELVNGVRESPVKIFVNNNKSEYLIAYHLEGDTKDAFGVFEIGYTNNEILKSKWIQTSYKTFMTENQVKLSITKDDLIKIKGQGFRISSSKKEDSIIRYEISDYRGSAFCKRYNMAGYFYECTVRNSKIIKIKFGFEYP